LGTKTSDVPATVADLVFHASGRFPRPNLIGRAGASGVTWTSGRELVEIVRDISLGLGALGMQKGDRVALVSESRPEWLFLDLAIVAAGAVTTPLYPTLAAEQMRAILQDSEPKLAVVSTEMQLAKLLTVLPQMPALRTIVTIDACEGRVAIGGGTVLTLAQVAARGHRRIMDGWGVGREFQETAKGLRPADPATLIYTSGTTGTPKGVLLTHGNLMANVDGVCQVLDLRDDDTALSFLPLCHAFERTVSYVYLTRGVSIVFAESIDTVGRDLLTVRPTIMTGVPRVFEKLESRMLEAGRAAGGLKRRLFDWAIGVARQRGALLPDGKPLPWLLEQQSRLADALVFKRLREAVGGRLRFAVSGGAPLHADAGRFFFGLGLPILEGYGLTETAPVLSVMPLERIRFGTVGPPLPNVELQIASDGEVLARGPSVMAGYYHRPEDSAAALAGGWFHTGDLGSLDDLGYLRITGRKKDLLVTSGGKKIVPHVIEDALKMHALIEEAVVIADGRHFVTALLVPHFDVLARELGQSSPPDAAARAALVAQPDATARLQTAVDAVNSHLAQFERIKRFAILPRDLTVAAGELTPTLKVKRMVVEERYAKLIHDLYY
jgi:long-chain acyl-CoA synthetase